MIEKISEQEVEKFLAENPDWSLREGKLHRAYKFKDFNQAFAFMTRVAMLAERENHHPEWCNVYNRLEVNLITHEADGLTARDIKLATAMEDFARS